MKALTIWQPWASLIAVGAKRIETRPWSTRYRGPLAIHAALSKKGLDTFHTDPFHGILKAAGFAMPRWLPRCQVVALCNLVDVVPVEQVRATLSQQELDFGDFGNRRYAWLLQDVHSLLFPISARGQQGLWNWEHTGEREVEMAIEQMDVSIEQPGLL